MGFPSIPGIPSPDGIANPLVVYSLGADLRYNDLSGVVENQPPDIEGIIPPLVPRVDADGNEVAGIHTVLQQAALGTYLGWNITASGYSKGQFCSVWGSYIPFAKTKRERIAAHDSRISLEERYGTQRGYLCVVRRAADKLVTERFLLRADADIMVQQAASSVTVPWNVAGSIDNEKIADTRCDNPTQ